MIKISKASYKETKAFRKKEWAQEDRWHYGQEVNWNERKYLLKATDGVGVVGFLKLTIEAGVAEIHNIIVSSEKRGQGIGKKLVQGAEKIAKKQACHKLFLHTGKDWEAVEFYKSLGYEITAQMPRHYFKKDFVEFSKFL